MANYDELRLENQLIWQRMKKMEKHIHGLHRAVSRKREAINDLSSTDDTIISLDPPERKRYKKNRSKVGKTLSNIKCSKCNEQFKSLLLLAKHKCISDAKSNQRFSTTKIPGMATSFNSSLVSFRSNSVLSSTKVPGMIQRYGSSSSSGYEMSSVSDQIERMDFSGSTEIIDLTECSMDTFETAHSFNSSGRGSALSVIDETDQSNYDSALSNLSGELRTIGMR